jgi:hypothetical protein
MPLIEPLNGVKSISIDYPFTQKGDFRSDGNLATSFYTTKIMIDRAIQLGFNTVSFETNVPINVQTGELQLNVASDPYNGDKSFPEAIWDSVRYAESRGLKTVIDLCIRNALNDVPVMTANVGKEFNERTFFNTVKKYETEIAKKANEYGVDGIRISKFNFGYDSAKYGAEWIDIVSSIRSVYSGSLRYLSNPESVGNSIWSAVDEVQFSLSPTFSLKSTYSKADITPLYFDTYLMGNGIQSTESAYSKIKKLVATYPNKKISIEASFSPGQSAGYENANPWNYVFAEDPQSVNAKDQKTLIPYPENRIDTKLNQEKIAGFLEFFGNYISKDISGIQFWQYMPWTEAAWIKNPMTNNGQVWQSVIRAMSALNWQSQSEELIATYLLKDWGFKTLHYGTDKNDTLSGTEVNDIFFYSPGKDTLNGENGIDSILINDKASNFLALSSKNSWFLESSVFSLPNQNQTTLTNIERLKFSDTNIALDIGATQNAGSVYMLYKAAFNRPSDTIGMGYWISLKDGGANIVTNIAQGFVNSAEFIAKYGANPTNASYVSNLYQNVLGRAGEAGGVAYWIGEMDAGRVSKAQALVSFATLPEGAGIVAPLIANGIAYAEWIS